MIIIRGCQSRRQKAVGRKQKAVGGDFRRCRATTVPSRWTYALPVVSIGLPEKTELFSANLSALRGSAVILLLPRGFQRSDAKNAEAYRVLCGLT